MENYEDIRNSSSKNISSFPNDISVLKIAKDARIIIQKKNILNNDQDISFYFVRAAIMGSDIDYHWNAVARPLIKKGDWLTRNPLSEENISDARVKFMSISNSTQVSKQPPPISELQWLENFGISVKYNFYESEGWMRYTLSESQAEGIRDKDVPLFRKLLQDFLDGRLGELLKNGSNWNTYQVRNDSLVLFITVVQIQSDKLYILENGAHEKEQESFLRSITDKISETVSGYNFQSIDDVRRYAVRAYSQLVVSDQDLWYSVQKSRDNVNLSLLGEQIEFLIKCPLPSYIDAQAGSGKTTIMCYLFAQAFYYKCAGEIKGDIIFLTENNSLLDQTRKTVLRILEREPSFNGIPRESRSLDSIFYSFKSFLLSCIEEEDKENFKENKYLDFSAFSNLYENYARTSNIRNYSAEETWFVINTFIRGYNSEELNREDYDLKIERDDRENISKERFEEIYDRVLPFYNRLLNNEGWWDKIKIIKYLQKTKSSRYYSFVFCDEAQDFSRIELSFILSRCTLITYDLSNASKVPIVFAGDPSQTVSPTGFRGAEIKSMLHQELTNSNFRLSGDNFSYEPRFNYRSAKHIVELANLIQDYRVRKRYISSRTKQESRRPTASDVNQSNIFIDINTLTDNSDLIERFSYKKFIVPADNVQEKEQYLNEIKNLLKIDVDVRTAIEAKGDDFEQVVLFKFGKYFLDNLINSEDAFKKKYFFNKLYVAVTRAQTELIIVDSSNSEHDFWRNEMGLSNDQLISGVETVVPSKRNLVEENAIKDKETGIKDNNYLRVQIAANEFYILEGKSKEYFDCLAICEEIKQNWDKAAEIHENNIEMGPARFIKVVNCFWNAKKWSEIIARQQYISYERSLRTKFLAARVMTLEDIDSVEMKYFLNNISDIEISLREDSDFLDQFSEKLFNYFRKAMDVTLKRDVAEVLRKLHSRDSSPFLSRIGKLYYLLHDYDISVAIFERISNDLDELDNINDTQDYRLEYYDSKLKIAERENDYVKVVQYLSHIVETANKKNDISARDSYEQRIVKTYEDVSNDIENIKNIGFFSNILKVLLVKYPFRNNLNRLLETYEMIAKDSKFIIANFYKSILSDNRIDKKIIGFLLERWAKYSYEDGQNLRQEEEIIDEINESYRLIAGDLGIDFDPFTIEEIAVIPQLPDYKYDVFPSFYRNITIKNFKAFHCLELHNLGLFNIILGDNNTGKTSLLEALLVVREGAEYTRRLYWAFADRRQDTNFKNDFIDKYFAFGCESIDYEIKSGRNYINVSFHKDQMKVLSLDMLKQIDHLDRTQRLTVPIVPFGKVFSTSLAKVYRETIDLRRDTRKNFLEKMKVFIPNIDRISVDTETGDVDIEEEGRDMPISIDQYGEGANKFFRIILHFENSANSIILIDEVDSGIHYSHYKDFISIIFDLAIENKVQVFATTHNNEFLKAVCDVLQEKELALKEFRVLTLRKSSDGVKLYQRDFNDVKAALSSDFDIRGAKL